MDQNQRNALRQNRIDIVNDLEPRDVLDHLLEDAVLTENDCELITNGKTRKERCHIFLSLLPTRGNSYGSFLKALVDTRYAFLEEKLRTEDLTYTVPKVVDDHDESNSQKQAVCSRCNHFISCSAEATDFSIILKNHCCLLLDNIEPNDILDYHYQEEILCEDDCERIRMGTTRKDRCTKMLQELAKCSNANLVPVFQKSLVKKYKYLAEAIHKTMKNNSTTNQCPSQNKTESQKSSTRLSPVYKNEGKTLPLLDVNSLLESNEDSHSASPESSGTRIIASETKVIPPSSELLDSVLEGSFTQSILSTEEQKSHLNENQADSASAFLPSTRECEGNVHASSPHAKGLQTSDLQKKKTDLYNGKIRPIPSSLEPEDTGHKYEETFNEVFHQDISLKAEKSSYIYNNQTFRQRSSSSETETQDAMKQKLPKRRKTKKVIPNESCKQVAVHEPRHEKYCVFIHPGYVSVNDLPNKKLLTAFNCLSNLINQGRYEEFEMISMNVRQKYAGNADMMCILGYLHASRDLFRKDFDGAKGHINSAFKLVPKTSNPKYFTLELFTAKTRMYISRKKLEKLQSTLDDAKMIIESDIFGCTGRAAGWLYMNDARNKTAQIALLNVHSPNYIDTYQKLHNMAENSFRRALLNFIQDGGKDGPFGTGYALCRLVILLMRCGDNGLTMNILNPTEDDVKLAGGYLRELEDSDIAIPKILEVHYLLAKCDYQFRRRNVIRALEYAEAAFNLSTEIQMLEFTEHAHNRFVFLKTKSPLIVEEKDSVEEVYEVLLNTEEDSDNKKEELNQSM